MTVTGTLTCHVPMSDEALAEWFRRRDTGSSAMISPEEAAEISKVTTRSVEGVLRVSEMISSLLLRLGEKPTRKAILALLKAGL